MDSTSSIWEHDAPAEYPTLTGEKEADFCVVGLGGSGLTCIGELLRLGHSVIGVDAKRVGAGAAGRNGGFLLAGLASFYHDLVQRHGRKHARQLYELSVHEIERIASETPELVRIVGSLRIASSDEEFQDCQRHMDALERDGFRVFTYEGNEGRGLLLPTDGVFQPLQRCEALARRCVSTGASLFTNSLVTKISDNGVSTSAGTVRSKKTIVAVDGNMEVIFPELHDRVRTARLQMLASKPIGIVRFSRPVYTRWGYDYWQQLPDTTIALGGFRDKGGDAEWTHNAAVSDRVQFFLDRFLRDQLGITAGVTHRWSSVVSYSNTGLPIIEEVRPNVWAIGAYSGTGNVIGALCGRAVAQLAANGESELAEPFLRILS